MAELFVGTAAVAAGAGGTEAGIGATALIGGSSAWTGAAATSGLIGSGGSVTAAGLGGFLGTTALVGGLGLGALGMMQQGQAAAAQARGQQAVAEYNAKVQEQHARAIELQTQYKQNRLAEQASRQESSLLAAAGASGTVPSVGSPLMIQAKQAAQSELDNLMTGYTGNIAASQARSQGTIDSLQAGIYGQQARNYGTAGMIGAGTSLLTGFGDYAAKKYGY